MSLPFGEQANRTPGVQQKMWDTFSPAGEGGPARDRVGGFKAAAVPSCSLAHSCPKNVQLVVKTERRDRLLTEESARVPTLLDCDLGPMVHVPPLAR